MRKIFLVVIVVIALAMVVVMNALASTMYLVCHKDNGHGAVEKWKWVTERALPAHLGHGDSLYPDVLVCGGVSVPSPTQTPTCPGGCNPVDTPTASPTPMELIVETPTAQPLIPDPTPTEMPLPFDIKLFLPFLSSECRGLPWCLPPIDWGLINP